MKKVIAWVFAVTLAVAGLIAVPVVANATSQDGACYTQGEDGVPNWVWSREQDRSSTNTYTPGSDEVKPTKEHKYKTVGTYWTVEHKKVRSKNSWTANELTWLGTNGTALGGNEWQLKDSVVNGANINPLTLPQQTWTSLPNGLAAYGGPSSSDVDYYITKSDLFGSDPGGFRQGPFSTTTWYSNGDWVENDPGSPWVIADTRDKPGTGSAATYGSWSGWTPALDNANGWTGDAPVVPDPILGSGDLADLTWNQHREQSVTSDVKPAGKGWVKGEQDGWKVEPVEPREIPCPVVNECANVLSGDTSTNLNPLWVNVDTRPAGHYEYVDGGLHVWTDTDASGSPDPRKVSLGRDLSFPLKHTGTLGIDYTNTGSFPYGPGVNLFVDFDDNGSVDGTLVFEEVYGQDLWLTGGSAQFVKDAAPSHTGGNGSENHGTIDGWLAAFPDAQVEGFAFALGSGVNGEGTIHSITVGCADFTFDYVAPPTEVTPQEPTAVDVCGADNIVVEVPADTETAVYAQVTNEDGSITVTATARDGYVFPEGTVSEWTFTDSGVVCPPDDETPPPPATPVKHRPHYTG